jgi:hypothetical protein
MGSERTEPRSPLSTSVSKPPSPPWTVPLSDPLASKTNVSSLPAAPVRCSKPLKETPATLPEPVPVIDQTTSVAGPSSLSLPAPPTKLIETGSAVPSVNTSSPAVPWIVIPAALASERRETAPSTTITSSFPSTVSLIVLPAGPRLGASVSAITSSDGIWSDQS